MTEGTFDAKREEIQLLLQSRESSKDSTPINFVCANSQLVRIRQAESLAFRVFLERVSATSKASPDFDQIRSLKGLLREPQPSC